MIAVKRAPAPDIFASSAARKEREKAARFFRRPVEKRAQEKFAFQLHRHPEVRAALTELFHGKCAYCETSIQATQPIDVDHYRPKVRALDLDGSVAPDHYWWLAAEWANLLPSCIDCNRSKGPRFPVGAIRALPGTYGSDLRKEKPLLLDPCVDRPERHLVFSEDGVVQSDTRRGTTSIEVLGLNRTGLVEARRKRCHGLTARLEISEHLFRLLEEDASNDEVRARARDELSAIHAFLEPSQEFAALHRQFVTRWLHDLGLELSELSKQAQPLMQEAAKKARLVTEEQERETVSRFKVHSARQQDYSVEAPELAHRETFYSGAKRIEWLEIENFRAIERIQLTFPPPRSENEPWLMLLGENGTGKSSVLQAVALALMGESHARELELCASDFVRRDAGRSWGRVRVKLTNIPEPMVLRFRRSSTDFVYETPEPKALLLGYGATRLLRPRLTGPGSGPGYIRVKNLFDPTAPLDDVESWLLNRNVVDDASFEVIASALKDLLMLEAEDRFARGSDDVEAIIGDFRPVPLRQLSDGFQAIVALCADIMKILLERWPSVQDAEGIVLLDELDAHLHPTWKIEVVERLRRTFPRVAFLASTHDPLCLKGLQEGEIAVLSRDERRRIAATTDVPPVNDLRADQILTSVLFGLHSTRGDGTTAAIDRYAQLLGKRRPSDAEQKELTQLEQRLESTLSTKESARERHAEQALWEALVEDGTMAEKAGARAERVRPRRTTPQEVELRRQLAELLEPE